MLKRYLAHRLRQVAARLDPPPVVSYLPCTSHCFISTIPAAGCDPKATPAAANELAFRARYG